MKKGEGADSTWGVWGWGGGVGARGAGGGRMGGARGLEGEPRMEGRTRGDVSRGDSDEKG